MAKPQMSDQQLTEYSGEHLMHELSMFWELPGILPKYQQGTEHVALLESFAVHLRNLIEFFCFASEEDYIRAEDFVDAPAVWPAKMKLTATLKKALQRANEEVAHLTTGRKSGNPPDKVWYTNDLLNEIAAVGKEFAGLASEKKLHPKVREFLQVPPDKALLWIGKTIIVCENCGLFTNA